MNASTKLRSNAIFPDMRWDRVGDGQVAPASGDGWRMLVIYRGRHCPLCKKYLKTLDSMLGEFAEAKVGVMVVSADSAEKAEADVAEEGWRFPVGYGLILPQMQELGLYVSEPRFPGQTDGLHAEPGLFVINAQGRTHVIDVSNAPFARPDLGQVLFGIKLVRERNYTPTGAYV